jgi:hypothetical protein
VTATSNLLSVMRSWGRRSCQEDRDRPARPERVRGRPPSANGASSFHLWWNLPPRRWTRLEVTLEVLRPPMVDRLYFWALQASFHDGRRTRGAGHTGLQWSPGPDGPRRAVNWGGYGDPADGGGELDGTVPELPLVDANPNTCEYDWRPGCAYRLAVYPSPGTGWRAGVTDEVSGRLTTVRDLRAPGRWLTSPVVWSEVFADCDQPSVAVRWSRPLAVAEDGREVAPREMTVTYQEHGQGGCTNTSVAVDQVGVLQVTTVWRSVPHGAVIALPGQCLRQQRHAGPVEADHHHGAGSTDLNRPQ